MRNAGLFALTLFLGLGAAPAGAVSVETVTTPGGITVWLVEDHTQKVISLDFSMASGAASDPKDKSGLATFAMGLLDEGAGPYDSGQYQGRLEDLNAELDGPPSVAARPSIQPLRRRSMPRLTSSRG